jgi:hypothetical protein
LLERSGYATSRSDKTRSSKIMLAVSQSDYESIYDQVTQLNLKEYESGQPIISTGGGFENERALLRKLSVKKRYAPLIPVLFNRWKNLEKHWIGSSMLLHAVCGDAVSNTQELLKVGVNPNQSALYFFQNDYFPTPIVLVAMRMLTEDLRVKDPQMVNVLFAHGLKVEPQAGNSLLMEAIQSYLHCGGDQYKFVIHTLVEQGIDPRAEGQEESVCCNGQTYYGCSAYSLVSQLVTVDYCNEQEFNADHKNRFQELLLLFDKSTVEKFK